MATENRKLITPIEAADMACLPTGRLLKLAKAGKVPHVAYPDGEISFDRDELTAWINQHHRGATGATS